MQTTTQITSNLLKAKRLLELREQLKTLALEEKILKKYFTELLDTRESDDILVQSAILISRYHMTRESFDSKALTSWFNEHNVDVNQFKNVTHYETLKIKAV